MVGADKVGRSILRSYIAWFLILKVPSKVLFLIIAFVVIVDCVLG